jgi:predicted transcriptional regulator YdeE
MSTIMSQNFATLRKYSKKNKLSITWWFTLYTKTNLLKETFEFVWCLTTATSDVSSLPDGIETYSTQAWKYLRVTHRWDYTYIENSRSALYGAAMALKKKNNKKIPSYEKYIIWPEQSKDSSTWVTEIYLPLK